MITASQEMRDAAGTTHAPRWRITTSDGQDWTPRLLSGRIVRDSDQAPRSRLALTLATEGAPVLLDQGLLPTGRDVYADYWHYPVAEFVRVFTGRLISSALTRTDSLWTLDAIDHSGTMQADLISPGGITVPPTVAELAAALVHRTLPQAVLHISGPALTAPVPADLTIDGSPWDIIETACSSCGCEAYFDAAGDCVIRPEPALSDPVDALRTGPQGVVTAYETAHEAAYSRVELLYRQGSGDTEQRLTGVWEDHRADSPTSVERIGRVTLRQTDGSGLWPSQEQADSAAAARAARSAGRGRQTTLHHIARPWIEPGDTIEVALAGGPTELQLVAGVDIPLQPDAQATKLRNDAYSIVEEGPDVPPPPSGPVWAVTAANVRGDGNGLTDTTGNSRDAMFSATKPLVLPHTGADYLNIPTGTASANHLTGITPNVPATASMTWDLETTASLGSGFNLIYQGGTNNGTVLVLITSSGDWRVSTWVGGVIKTLTWAAAVTVNTRKTYRVDLTTTGAELFINDVSQGLKAFGATRIPAINTSSSLLMTTGATTPTYYRVYSFNLYGALILNLDNVNTAMTSITNSGSQGGAWTINRAATGIKTALVDRPQVLFAGANQARAAMPAITAGTVLVACRLWKDTTINCRVWAGTDTGDGARQSLATNTNTLISQVTVGADTTTRADYAVTSGQHVIGARLSGIFEGLLDGAVAAIDATPMAGAQLIAAEMQIGDGAGTHFEFIAAKLWDRPLDADELAAESAALLGGGAP